MKLSHFPHDCKLAKFKPLYKEGSKTDLKKYLPIFWAFNWDETYRFTKGI